MFQTSKIHPGGRIRGFLAQTVVPDVVIIVYYALCKFV